MKFYHYPHCPFCQRVRLALKFKKIEYEDIPLSYADVDMPTKLIGSKMLPIIDFGDGTIMAESLDLLEALEKRFPEPTLSHQWLVPDLDWAQKIVVSIPQYFDVTLPYFLDDYEGAPEFDAAGIKYFQEGKEAKRGQTFAEMKAAVPALYEKNIKPILNVISEKVGDAWIGPQFSMADCVLASDLSGLRSVRDVSVSALIIRYIERVEEECGTDLIDW